MPKMYPFDAPKSVNATPVPELPASLENILEDHGLTPKGDKKVKLDEARSAFSNAGADLNAVADTVSRIMKFGETDSGRLKASELVLRVHGILNEIDEKTVPVINITVNGSDNKTLINLVLPQ